MTRTASLLALPAIFVVAACSAKAATSPADSAPPAAAPPSTAAAPPSTAAVPAPPAPAAEAAAPPASAAPAAPSATAAADAPLPAVKVANIGMHIGGGPNDDITKDPIRRSVQPHFDAFRRCFAQVEDAGKGGDFGVDLRIDKAGGKAQVSHPRTALKGKELKACVVRVFEGIDFLPPRGGTTTVSYSLRFTPTKGGS